MNSLQGCLSFTSPNRSFASSVRAKHESNSRNLGSSLFVIDPFDVINVQLILLCCIDRLSCDGIYQHSGNKKEGHLPPILTMNRLPSDHIW